MIIDLSTAKIGDVISGQEKVSLPNELLDREGKFASDGEVDFDVVLVSENEVGVTGQIRYTISTICDKCGEDCVYNGKCPLRATFSTTPEEDVYPFNGVEINLEKAVHDSVILDLPTKVLCKSDCAGLCPTCGKNLNTGKCKCKESEIEDSNPFSALRQIDFSGGAE